MKSLPLLDGWKAIRFVTWFLLMEISARQCGVLLGSRQVDPLCSPCRGKDVHKLARAQQRPSLQELPPTMLKHILQRTT